MTAQDLLTVATYLEEEATRYAKNEPRRREMEASAAALRALAATVSP